MRIVRFAVPAVALAAWWAISFAQQPPQPQPQPPAAQAPAPAEEARPAAPPPAPADEDEPEAPAADDEVDDVFIPTEELQPDAAVTFPVDI